MSSDEQGSELNTMCDLSAGSLVEAMQQAVTLNQFLERYGTGRRRSMMEPVYADMLSEAWYLIDPLSLHQRYPAEELPEVARHMSGAVDITLGICSIGTRLDSRVEELSVEKLAYAVVLDEIGTAMVLELGNQMFQRIRQHEKEKGWRASPSYRPGIGRWPLKLQRELFESLGAKNHGLRLIESMQILPQKTVSMIVGAGPDFRIRRNSTRYYSGYPN